MKQFIVGLGEALWDVLPEGKKLGGAPANFAYHISRFGLEGIAVSAIGDDRLGDEIIEQLDEKRLKHNMEVVPFPTGTVQIEIDSAGVPRYDIKENVAWDNMPFTQSVADIAANTKAVCFGTLAQRSEVSRRTINLFVDTVAKGDNPLIVFDINLRQHYYTKEIIENSLRKSNILKINDEELEVVGEMFGMGDVDFQGKCQMLLARYGLRMLILTCGAVGSYVFTPDDTTFMKTPKVEVADTVGAGDSFTAAFIASIIKGKTVSEAHKIAVETSAYVCTQKGAMPAYEPHLL